jgi:RNA-directed DNA polymerase
MRRAGNLFDAVSDRENLRLAFSRAIRGKRDRPDVREFGSDLEGSLASLAADIVAGRLTLGQSSQFTIYDPKERIITAPAFRERVLHHAILNVCEPAFEQFLIDDTFACRAGRGRIAALQRAQTFCRRYPHAVKIDMRHYFDSIPHAGLLSRLQRRFKDRRLLELFELIIHSHSSGVGRGLPIGSLTSQHFANFYLGWFDRFVKESLRLRGYLRYMDDCVLWGDSPSSIREYTKACRQFLEQELNLEIHQSPPTFRVRSGVELLGCRVFPDRLQLNRRSRHRYRARLRDLDEGFLRGELTEAELQQRSEALTAFTIAGGVRSWKFRQRVLEGLPVSGHGARTG